jgi:hypothetical protein
MTAASGGTHRFAAIAAWSAANRTAGETTGADDNYWGRGESLEADRMPADKRAVVGRSKTTGQQEATLVLAAFLSLLLFAWGAAEFIRSL